DRQAPFGHDPEEGRPALDREPGAARPVGEGYALVAEFGEQARRQREGPGIVDVVIGVAGIVLSPSMDDKGNTPRGEEAYARVARRRSRDDHAVDEPAIGKAPVVGELVHRRGDVNDEVDLAIGEGLAQRGEEIDEMG